MTLDYPLLGLINTCETLCEAACCGRDAYDFSPIHAASFLIRHTGKIEQADVETIREQLQRLDAEYGRCGSVSDGATIKHMNQIFTGAEISALVAELRDCLVRACELVRTA